ncbi:MAG: ornithine carbamoyltransferase [Elusimicrobiales bacterium]
MNRKDFLRVADYTIDDINEVFGVAREIKDKLKKGIPYTPLAGKTLGMIFQKSSTRTRVSFEVGMYQLGGYPLFLSSADLQLKRGETISDTANVLSRYLDGIMIRTFAQSDVEELAANASIPVINGLTDDHHPCQILADIFTITEKRGNVKGLTVAWIGDGNNVLHSWVEGCALTGMNLRIAVPEGFDPKKEIMDWGYAQAKKTGVKIELFRDPKQAAKGADVLYTDVWTSMGQEAEKERRLKAFAGYQIDGELLKIANKGALVMHCLPAHRGEEISAEAMDGPQSVVFDEAENRLHLQKGILALHLGKDWKNAPAREAAMLQTAPRHCCASKKTCCGH